MQECDFALGYPRSGAAGDACRRFFSPGRCSAASTALAIAASGRSGASSSTCSAHSRWGPGEKLLVKD